MKLSNIITLITFSFIERNSAVLTAAEEKCLIATAQNLQIKHVVIIREETKLSLDYIRLMKNMWKYNIFTQYRSFYRLRWSFFYDESNIFKRKTLYLLDTYSFSENLPMIFNETYELFLSDNVWATFNKNQDFKNLYIPYNCQFIVIESEDGQNFNLREYYNTRIHTRDLFVTNFAKWNGKNHFQTSELDFYQRRFDANQTSLVITADYLVSIKKFTYIKT